MRGAEPGAADIDAGSGVGRQGTPAESRLDPLILVIMGVSGVGKSTIAAALASRLGWPFEEGDRLHPKANIAKMHAGIPLTDEDRLPWLQRIAAWIDARRAQKEPGIITCSALKRAYREIVVGRRREVRLIYLRGTAKQIAAHLAGRKGHFMPASLLQSQIDALEEPGSDENALTIDVGPPADQVVEDVVDRLLHESAGEARRAGKARI